MAARKGPIKMNDQLKYLTPRAAMYLKASEYIGLTEMPGEQHNPQILTFFQDIGHNWVQDDETHWCAAFIDWVALKCGCERSFKLDAKSWLKVGTLIEIPELGDLVIFWREDPDSWKGHVGLWAGWNKKHIWSLGGNQNGQVNVSSYPRIRLEGFRRVEYLTAA